MAPQDAIFTLTNKRADDAMERIEAVLRALNDKIAGLVLDVNARGIKDGDARALEEARRIREQVIATARREGMAILIAEAEEQAARMAAEIADEMDFGDFSPDAAREIERIVRDQTKEIEAVFKDAAPAIRKAMDVRSLTDGPALRSATEDVARVIETSFVRASTAVETAISGASRSSIVNLAEGAALEADVEFVYLYTGPADSRTREFCREHVGKAWSKARLDADGRAAGVEPAPAHVYGGGWSCRHALSPILVEDAEADGIEVVR